MHLEPLAAPGLPRAATTTRLGRSGFDARALVDRLLGIVWERGGSDLHCTVGSPPRVRVDGQLDPLDDADALSSGAVWDVLDELLTAAQTEQLRARGAIDFSFTWDGQARVRGNAFLQRGEPALALRVIPNQVASVEQLGLPPAVRALADLRQGLVLFTGPTGSGKSTSLASLIDRINTTRAHHILTIEDPIEYLHEHKRSMIAQREIGLDAATFPEALRSALREDPDVILVGEMRDPESIAFTLTLAETGHLVFSTLHTNDTSQALDRIVDVFPPERQEQIRVQLAGSLSAVVAQRLVPKPDAGRAAAFEVLIATTAVRNLIREGKTRQVRNTMVTGQAQGMQTLEMSLTSLVRAGIVTHEAAELVALVPGEVGR